ncbi:MAG: hypothetical protein FJ206_08095 [Gemmatimonadetes bacterium]|nr:hypothetical protein [Gemmatimonadota bacterium]
MAVVLLAVALAACRVSSPDVPPELLAVGGHPSLIRVPLGGGTVEAYDPDSLVEPVWTSRAPVPRLREVLGINLEARLLLAVDTGKALVAVDLESRRVRTLLSGAESAVMARDGAVYVINAARRITRVGAGVPTPYRAALPVPPVFHAGTLGERYVGLLGTKPPKLLIINPDRQLGSVDVESGEASAPPWGDLVAITAADRVVIYNTEEPFGFRTLEPSGQPRHVTFSPSGHRLYVATDEPSIQVYDRFGLERLATIEVPGVPHQFRTDGSGRWMVARPETGDSAWVIDLATNRYALTADSEWAPDLPTVAGAGTALLRRDGDLIAIDLSNRGAEIGRVPQGGKDAWLVTSWVPEDRLARLESRAESLLVVQDSMLAVDSGATASELGDRLYLQVSSSQNPDWSKDLAKQLSDGGYPTRVLDPTNPDEGYRVVVGPYASRDAAEEAGRKLGRPYFILTNPPLRN